MQALWRGFLNFGLVSIPINLFSAVKSRELQFHLFHKKDKGKIKYAKICEKDNKEVLWEEIIKGYEYSKGKYVYLENDDFEKANVHKVNSIDIEDFVNEAEIDPIFYTKPYFLTPDKNHKPYILLLQALLETKKIAIAKFVIHNHEHIATIKPYSNLLILNQLRYLDEIKSTKNFQIATTKKKSFKELNIAIKLIEEHSGSFKPQDYKDSYTQDLKKLINQKAKGRQIFAFGKKPKSTKNKDIAFLLERSIKSRKRKKIA